MTTAGAVVPLPGSLHNLRDVLVLGNPAQNLSSFAGVCNQAGGVALTARTILHGSLHAGYLLGGIDNLLHGEAIAGTEVEPVGVTTLHQVIQSAQVGIGQVVYMDVVADDVTYENIYYTGAKDTRISFSGYADGADIKNIHIKDCHIGGKKINKSYKYNYNTYVSDVNIE